MREVVTRSEIKNDIDKIFQPQGDVETFLDVLRDRTMQNADHPRLKDSLVRKIVAGEPDKVKAPKLLSESISGFVRIFFGWHKKDFVWHIEPAAIRRPWSIPVSKVIYIIARIMHEYLPQDTEAKIWPPQDDWELRTITFKAIGLADSWSFTDQDVERINQKLFEVLNPVV